MSEKLLKKEVKRLRLVLENIADPIPAMEKSLPKGYKLDGQAAISLANDPETYRSIARAALKKCTNC